MEGLQEEVGGDEAGELVVVVVLVDMEQLQVVGRHDGEAVAPERLHQSRLLAAQLVGIDDVRRVDDGPLRCVEVVRLQLILAGLQPLYERLFLPRIADRCHLPHEHVAILVVAHLAPEAFLHHLVVPRRGVEQSAQVGVHEAVALPRGESVAQHAQFADAQLRDVHVEVNLLVELFHVDVPLARQNDALVVGIACQHRQHGYQCQNSFLHICCVFS